MYRPSFAASNQRKGEIGELVARLALIFRGVLPIPMAKRNGVHGIDLLCLLERHTVPPILDPFCGPGVWLMPVEVKAGRGLLMRANCTALLTGKGRGKQMGHDWRADQFSIRRRQDRTVARLWRKAGGKQVPTMAIVDVTPGAERVALVRINDAATAELGQRIVIADDTSLPGFGSMVRNLWSGGAAAAGDADLLISDPPYSSSYAINGRWSPRASPDGLPPTGLAVTP
jgi:hypothetical protein